MNANIAVWARHLWAARCAGSNAAMALFDAGPTRRVLCLHGGGSRAEILRMQLRPFFASAIGKGLALDFECIDGMYECVGDPMLEALYPGKFYSYVNKTTSAKSSYASKDLYPHQSSIICFKRRQR